MTRMWMVDPRLLCRQHLLGEHKELHQLTGSIRHGRLNAVLGHARLRQVDVARIEDRHEELVQEMRRRGYNHQSPLPEFEVPGLPDFGGPDAERNLVELSGRCEECRKRIDSVLTTEEGRR